MKTASTGRRPVPPGAPDPPATTSQEMTRAGGETLGDVVYDAFHGAAVGGSVIAVFFLVADTIAARPLFTPSLIGSVLFTGTPAESVNDVNLEMVAYFSAAHFVSFLVLGAAVSLMCRVSGLSKSNPVMVTGLVFAALTVGFFSADALVLGGVASIIGIPLVLVANLLTAGSMAGFLWWAHRAS